MLAPKPLPENLMKDIRKKSCGYSGIDPLICCPSGNIDLNRERSFRRDVTTEKPWIWDGRKAKIAPTLRNLDNRVHFDDDWYRNFLRPNDLPFYPKPFDKFGKSKFFSFDFEDPKTFRNCPPSFSRDFQVPLNFQHTKPIKNFHAINFPHDGGRNKNEDSVPNLIFSTANTISNGYPVFPKSTFAKPTAKTNLINSQDCGITVDSRIIGTYINF